MGRFTDWLFKAEAVEERAGGWTAFEDMSLAARSFAGVSVTQDNAINLPAVYRCVSLNSETVASMPVDCLAKRGDTRVDYPEPFWLYRPNDEQSWLEFAMQMEASLELDGNAFILKTSDPTGRLIALNVLVPRSVLVDRDTSGRLVYRVATVDGEQVFAATAIMHLKGLTLPGALRGLSPIAAAQQTIGTGFAAEQFGAQYFGSGAVLSGVITTPGTLTDDQAKRLQEAFQRKHGGVMKSHAIGVLSGGAAWTPLSVNPEESQFLETRRFTDVQIANLFGVPAEYVTDAEGAKGYVTGIFARQHMWLLTGINPRLIRIEQAFSDLLPTGVYIRFNRNSFLQMDPTERANFYAAGLRDQWLRPNEIRTREDMNPMPDGDETLQSVQWRGTSLADKVEAAGSLVRSGFDPAAALAVVGLPDMPYLDVQPVTLRPITEDGTQVAPVKGEDI